MAWGFSSPVSAGIWASDKYSAKRVAERLSAAHSSRARKALPAGSGRASTPGKVGRDPGPPKGVLQKGQVALRIAQGHGDLVEIECHSLLHGEPDALSPHFLGSRRGPRRIRRSRLRSPGSGGGTCGEKRYSRILSRRVPLWGASTTTRLRVQSGAKGLNCLGIGIECQGQNPGCLAGQHGCEACLQRVVESLMVEENRNLPLRYSFPSRPSRWRTGRSTRSLPGGLFRVSSGIFVPSRADRYQPPPTCWSLASSIS